MSDAVDDAIDRDEQYQLLLWEHRKKLCNPEHCIFCNGTYRDELFR